jgi:hypothetical protein
MAIPIFLSYPKPHLIKQSVFIEALVAYLHERGISPRTLGVNEYDVDAPLRSIRRLMVESNGMISIAFRRTWVPKAVSKKGTDISGGHENEIGETWFTSPWCHIEPAMAFQLGLPILILREAGVLDEGVLEKGVVGLYMPTFSLADDPITFLRSQEWTAIVQKWESQVRSVVEKKGQPPQLF